MTDTQWETELATALIGTDWIINWYGVIQQYPSCLADLQHRVTKAYKQVEVSRDAFRTPEARKAETLRQLLAP